MSWLFVGLVGAFAIIGQLMLVLLAAPLWDRRRRLPNLVLRCWGRILTRVLLPPLELRGLEHLRAGGPWVIVPNHQSVVDLLVLYRLPIDYRTVVKHSWVSTPMGLSIVLAGYVVTPKRVGVGGHRPLLARCAAWLQRGVSIMVFAEGTRSRDWHLLRFRRGPFELASQSGRPLLPVALAGTNDVSHPSSWRFRVCARLIVDVLPAIAVEGRTPEQLRDACRAQLAQRVGALRTELARDFRQGPRASS